MKTALKTLLGILLLFSCTSQNARISEYELAYNEITKNSRNEKPFLSEYNSDASGTKIISKISKFNNRIYGSQFDLKNAKNSRELAKLSKKYSKSNWRKDNEYRILQINEVKNFHGPLDYIYFSEIRNDSLQVHILGNPFGKYEMTTGEKYLITFDKGKIKTIKHWTDNFD